jgi:prepilin-type N-terminal cleavage/methylation domain-containing protein
MKKILQPTTYNLLPKLGFTLVELLISISIFMVFLALAAGSYGSLVKANRAANDMQKIYREVRFIFDTMAAEIRNGNLDYACINETQLDPLCLENQFSKVLSVLGKNNLNRSLFKFDESDKKLLALRQERAAADLPWSVNEWQPLASENFPLESLSFSFFPLKDPYESANAGNSDVQWQPLVTIRIKVAGFDFKTTYSSRTYGK